MRKRMKKIDENDESKRKKIKNSIIFQVKNDSNLIFIVDVINELCVLKPSSY